jgi:hypothetical protein
MSTVEPPSPIVPEQQQLLVYLWDIAPGAPRPEATSLKSRRPLKHTLRAEGGWGDAPSCSLPRRNSYTACLFVRVFVLDTWAVAKLL